MIELKRLEIARVLATEPALILLDEVMTGLTPTEITYALELIRINMKNQFSNVIVRIHLAKVLTEKNKN